MLTPKALASRKPEPDAPFCEWYLAAGASCAVATNSKHVLGAARLSLRQSMRPKDVSDLRMFLWVDPDSRGTPPWPQPHFRGLSHLVYAGLDSECSMLLDLRRRRVMGRFSPAMAQDAEYWQRVIFPSAVGLMSESLGLTTIHCACVERNGVGLLLSGASGAGKSTLALALARNGFALLSDDWTYFSGAGTQLRAWGLASPVKLLPDAPRHFPELASLKPVISSNGELAYEVDPESIFGISRTLTCEPRWLIFLERCDSRGYSIKGMSPHEAAARLEFDLEDLPVELSAVREIQLRTILELTGRGCWLLCHGGSPGEIAEVLARFCLNPPQQLHCAVRRLEEQIEPVRTGPDVIGRFTQTPLVAHLHTKNCAIRLETNSSVILKRAFDATGNLSVSGTASHSFLWRLVSDPGADSPLPWPTPTGFSSDGLYLENFGQHNFFAVDANVGVAVGVVAEALVNDSGFEKLFIARLVSATSTTAEISI